MGSSPNWTYGYVPSPAEWNLWWSNKQDDLGYSPLPLNGGQMTGPLKLAPSTVSAAGLLVTPGVAPSSPVDGELWTDASGIYVQINGGTIGPLGAGTAPVTWKNSAKYATPAALPANTYANGTAGVGATLTANVNGQLIIDGVVPNVADRILVRAEAAPSHNGIYVVTAIGTVGTPYVLTRATDYDTAAEIVPGTAISVSAGATLLNTAWIQGLTVTTVGTDPVQFTMLSSVYAAGDGLTLTGNVFALSPTTGTGPAVRQTGATLVTPALGTPASGIMTNMTGLPLAGSGAVLNLLPTANAGLPTVATTSALAALTTTKNTSAYLSQAGRQGIFVFSGSNLSTQVTADIQQGVYVAPASDPTGASGAWVRQLFAAGQYYASWFGVYGDGSDQTTAFNNMVTFLPTGGATVILPAGAIRATNITAIAGKTRIEFVGQGGGFFPNATVIIPTSASGAGAGTLIDASSSFAVSFKNIRFQVVNAAWDGILLNVDNTNYTTIDHCQFANQSTNDTGTMLRARSWREATVNQTSFENRGVAIDLDGSGNNNYIQVKFDPTGAVYPVIGSMGQSNWIGCIVQTSSFDGQSRFWNHGSTSTFCAALNFIGCGLYDPVNAGSAWIVCNWCQGFNFTGNLVGSASGQEAISIGSGTAGVFGINITGNYFSGGIAVGFHGTAGTTGCQDGIIAGNTSTVMYAGTASQTRLQLGPNFVGSAAGNLLGSHFNLSGVPTSATGLQTGDVWSNAGVLTIV